MLRTVHCLPLAFLFLVFVLPSYAQMEPSGPVGVEASGASEGDDGSLVVYEVKGNITLTCPLFKRDTDETILWKKNGTEVEELPELKERVRAEGNTLQWLKRAQEEDFGNYSCARDGAEHSWRVHARPHAKLPANSNVVEGQALKLVCKVVGKPYPAVTWRFANTSDEGEGEPLAAGDRDGRVKVSASEQEVAGAVLLVEDALRSDAGRYRCVVGPSGASADTVLRVKDMYAALWPFLGICAEVFILCAIILVYEKRRTKPELEDSDTDNHDQKKS